MGRKWLMNWSLLGLLLAGLLLPTQAQVDSAFGNLRVRVGAFFPSEKEFQDFNKTWFAVGVAYSLPALPLLGTNTELGVDIYTHQTGGSRGTIVPLTFNWTYTQAGAAEASARLSLGIGAYVIDAIGASKTVFGGRATLGLQLNENVALEVTYDITDRFDSSTGKTRANGLSVMIGYSF